MPIKNRLPGFKSRISRRRVANAATEHGKYWLLPIAIEVETDRCECGALPNARGAHRVFCEGEVEHG